MRKRTAAAKRRPAASRAPANVRNTPSTAKSRGARAARAAPDPALDARLAELRHAIATVQRTVDALERMSDAEVAGLPAPLREARARAIVDGLVAAQALRNDELRVLNDAFDDKLPALRRATRTLEAALERHDARAALVDAAASAIGIVANLFAIAG